MLLRASLVLAALAFASGAALQPGPSLAAEVKPKTPDSAFSGKLRPDILGISADSTADAARTAFEAAFRGRSDSKTDIGQAKFGTANYIATLNFSVPLGAKQSGETLVAGFSSPASENRVFFVSGGYAYGEVKNKVTELFCAAPMTTISFDETKGGYAVGGGVETPVPDFFNWKFPNWTTRTEYLYVDLGSVTNSYNYAGATHTLTNDVRNHIFRTTYSYKFGGL